MKIVEKEKGDTLVFNLAGEVNGVEAVQLSRRIERLQGSNYRRILIDMKDVAFIDSTAIGGIIFLVETMKKAGIDIILSGPSEHISELFRECNLEDILTISDY